MTVIILGGTIGRWFNRLKKRGAVQAFMDNDDMGRISYSDDVYAIYKPGKELHSKPDMTHPGSSNRFILIPENPSPPVKIKTEQKQNKMMNRNQNTNDMITDVTNETLKSFLLGKQSDENQIKIEMKEVYKKLAEDFEVLQDLLEKEKQSVYGNLSADGQNFIQESKLNGANNTSNILKIEDVNSNNGPLTKITLLRRNIVTKKK